MDHRGVQTWLDRYIEAWRTGDAAVIAELFGRDAEYRYHPADDPVVGPDKIAASWLADPDEPAGWDAWYTPFAVEGDRAVANGVSTYFNDDGSVRTVFDNVFLLVFNDEGRCTRFTEWFVQRPADRTQAPKPG
ncbi:MAG TPA: nuclear transport factor 2 family protein [Actinomycetota bacterium]